MGVVYFPRPKTFLGVNIPAVFGKQLVVVVHGLLGKLLVKDTDALNIDIYAAPNSKLNTNIDTHVNMIGGRAVGIF